MGVGGATCYRHVTEHVFPCSVNPSLAVTHTHTHTHTQTRQRHCLLGLFNPHGDLPWICGLYCTRNSTKAFEQHHPPSFLVFAPPANITRLAPKSRKNPKSIVSNFAPKYHTILKMPETQILSSPGTRQEWREARRVLLCSGRFLTSGCVRQLRASRAAREAMTFSCARGCSEWSHRGRIRVCGVERGAGACVCVCVCEEAPRRRPRNPPTWRDRACVCVFACACVSVGSVRKASEKKALPQFPASSVFQTQAEPNRNTQYSTLSCKVLFCPSKKFSFLGKSLTALRVRPPAGPAPPSLAPPPASCPPGPAT